MNTLQKQRLNKYHKVGAGDRSAFRELGGLMILQIIWNNMNAENIPRQLFLTDLSGFEK
jgi:hypothetical protein